MCIVCRDYVLDRLTLKEARNNFAEMQDSIDETHADEVILLLWADTTKLHKRALKKVYLEQEKANS